MKCTSYCTAASYRIKHLFEFLNKHYPYTKSYRDVIHAKVGDGDMFYFSFGCLVFWNVSDVLEKEAIKQVQEFEIDTLSEPNFDQFNYQFGETTTISVESDMIILHEAEPFLMLAFSFALAQSIKLVNFEDAVDKTIKKTEYIPQDLAKKGKIALSRGAISQQMGNLFMVRNSINLNTDFLGAPEFFWEHPSFENLYIKVATYLEIQKRVDVLNKRLDVIRELFEMLSDELRHQHSSTLEVIIIFLIAFEIFIVVAQQLAKAWF